MTTNDKLYPVVGRFEQDGPLVRLDNIGFTPTSETTLAGLLRLCFDVDEMEAKHRVLFDRRVARP